MSEIRIGCSGWNYKDWRGPFYPQGMATKNWFAFYAQSFDTVEINNSFYRLLSPSIACHHRTFSGNGAIRHPMVSAIAGAIRMHGSRIGLTG